MKDHGYLWVYQMQSRHGMSKPLLIRVLADLLAKCMLSLWVMIYSLPVHRMGLFWHGNLMLLRTPLNQLLHLRVTISLLSHLLLVLTGCTLVLWTILYEYGALKLCSVYRL